MKALGEMRRLMGLEPALPGFEEAEKQGKFRDEQVRKENEIKKQVFGRVQDLFETLDQAAYELCGLRNDLEELNPENPLEAESLFGPMISNEIGIFQDKLDVAIQMLRDLRENADQINSLMTAAREE